MAGQLLAACGDSAETAAPTQTPRPTFALETATPTTVAPTAAPVVTNRTPTPTPRNRLTPSPVPTPTPDIPTATPRPARVIGGDLITARDRDPSSLHPYGLADNVAREYRSLLYNAKLIRRNPTTLDWESFAARTFKYDDASRTVIFSLRTDLRWSDGSPITTDDFTWTYQMISDPGRGWLDWPQYSGKILSYTATDKFTLQVKLRDRYSDPLELANLVEPLPKAVWDRQSWAEFDKNTNINRPQVTSGPWKLKEWQTDKQIAFVPNPLSSCLPPPYLKSLTFIRADDKKALEMLRQGQIDFYNPPPDQFPAVSTMAKIVTYRWNPAMPAWNYLGFNFRRPLWQNINVRRALNTATNRREIIDTLSYGLGTPMYSDAPPGNPAFYKGVEKPDYDLKAAQDLLLTGGYRLNGYSLVGQDGKELPELTLLYNPDGQVRPRLADYFARQLGKLGFKVKTVAVDFQTMLNRLQDPAGDYDLFLLGWKPASIDLAQFGVSWQDNYGGYRNQQLTDLYTRAAREPDNTARRDLLNQVQQLEATDLPYLYLYAEVQYLAVAYYVQGVSESPLGATANCYTDWFIRI